MNNIKFFHLNVLMSQINKTHKNKSVHFCHRLLFLTGDLCCRDGVSQDPQEEAGVCQNKFQLCSRLHKDIEKSICSTVNQPTGGVWTATLFLQKQTASFFLLQLHMNERFSEKLNEKITSLQMKAKIILNHI